MSVATLESVAEAFEQRAARAASLAEAGGAAREPLRFASALCHAQSAVAASLERIHSSRAFTGRLAEDVERVLPLGADLLSAVCEKAPEPLATQAFGRLHEEEWIARSRMLTAWNGDVVARDDYLSRALIRPYAEFLRSARVTPDRMHTEGHCPFCGGAASIGSRSKDGEAIVRHLHCGVCGNAWIFNRMRCPACLETMSDKLPVFKTPSYPAVTVEGCDTCRRYVKSIDLTSDAHPDIDDLVSIALDVWAHEEGYTRIEPGLAGL